MHHRIGTWRHPGPRTLLLRPHPQRPLPVTAVGWTPGNDRVGLVHALWRRLYGTSLPSLELGRDTHGRPLLLGHETRGHALSFSRGGGLWGALCRAPGLGIDLAASSDFPPGYPWESAFAVGELPRLAALAGDRGGRAALAWSRKEAALKALGTGFRVVDPRSVETQDLGRSGPWLTARCGLAGVSLVLSRRLSGHWLALAWCG